MKKDIGRPKKAVKKTEALRVRLTAEERDALQGLSETLGVKPSKIVRRLVREAVTGGPDFFDDGIKELRESNRQLCAIGRNLNRLLKLLEMDKPINGIDLKNEYEGLKIGYAEMQRAYQDLMLNSKNRNVKGVRG